MDLNKRVPELLVEYKAATGVKKLRLEKELYKITEPIIKKAAKAFCLKAKAPHEYDDYAQESRVILTKAFNTFDAQRGVPFTAYATGLIWYRMYRYTQDTRSLVRVPASTRATLRKLSWDTCSQFQDVRLLAANSAVRGTISLDSAVHHEDEDSAGIRNSLTLAQALADAQNKSATDIETYTSLQQILNYIKYLLTPKEAMCLYAWAILGRDFSNTFKELFGVSRQCAQQQTNKALELLGTVINIDNEVFPTGIDKRGIIEARITALHARAQKAAKRHTHVEQAEAISAAIRQRKDRSRRKRKGRPYKVD